jgi:hypothetical protein
VGEVTGGARLRGTVISCPIDRLYTEGFGASDIQPDDPCPVCQCRFGDHVATLPGDTTLETLLDRTGMVECPSCDRGCGPWSIQLPGW